MDYGSRNYSLSPACNLRMDRFPGQKKKKNLRSAKRQMTLLLFSRIKSYEWMWGRKNLVFVIIFRFNTVYPKRLLNPIQFLIWFFQFLFFSHILFCLVTETNFNIFFICIFILFFFYLCKKEKNVTHVYLTALKFGIYRMIKDTIRNFQVLWLAHNRASFLLYISMNDCFCHFLRKLWLMSWPSNLRSYIYIHIYIYINQTNPIKWNAFFLNSGCVNTTIWMHHMDADKVHREKKVTAIAQECYELYWTIPGSNKNTKQKMYGHLPPISKTIPIRRTRHAGHCRKKLRTNHKRRYSVDSFTRTSRRWTTS